MPNNMLQLLSTKLSGLWLLWDFGDPRWRTNTQFVKQLLVKSGDA